jgi:hypothetical protein
MLLKLAFNKTMHGTLRVSATTARGSDHVLSIYDNDEAFTRLLEHSDLDPDTIRSLKESAELAYGSQNTSTCCEEMELTHAQLNILRLGEANRLYA